MAGSSKPVKLNPEQVEHAELMWDNFMAASKYALILSVITLVGLAAAFVPW